MKVSRKFCPQIKLFLLPIFLEPKPVSFLILIPIFTELLLLLLHPFSDHHQPSSECRSNLKVKPHFLLSCLSLSLSLSHTHTHTHTPTHTHTYSHSLTYTSTHTFTRIRSHFCRFLIFDSAAIKRNYIQRRQKCFHLQS